MWMYAKDGHKVGPVSFEEIVNLINAEIIVSSTIVCEEGKSPCRAGIHPELKLYFKNLEAASSSTNANSPNPFPAQTPVQPLGGKPQTPSRQTPNQAAPSVTVPPKINSSAEISHNAASSANNKTQKSNNAKPIMFIVFAFISLIIIGTGIGLFVLNKAKESNSLPSSEDVAININPEQDTTSDPEKVESPASSDNDEPSLLDDDSVFSDDQETPTPRKDNIGNGDKPRDNSHDSDNRNNKRRNRVLDQNAQNMVIAKRSGKTVVYVDNFRVKIDGVARDDYSCEFKSSEDLVPGYSKALNDFHNSYNFWTCLFSDNMLNRLGKINPALKTKILRARTNYRNLKDNSIPIILSCQLKPDNVDPSDETAVNGWVKFTVEYNKNMKDQNFQFNWKSNLKNNQNFRNIEFCSYIQNGRHIWVPTTVRGSTDQSSAYESLGNDTDSLNHFRSDKPVFFSSFDGVYSTAAFSLKTHPECMKDILLHPDNYRLEVLSICNHTRAASATVYPVSDVDNNNDNICNLENESKEDSAHQVKEAFYCDVLGMQVRNIKTDKVVAIVGDNELYTDVFQTEVVNLSAVIGNNSNEDELADEDVPFIDDVIDNHVGTTPPRPRQEFKPESNPSTKPKPEQPTKPKREQPVEKEDPDRLVIEIKGVEFVFRWIPAGIFTMGSPDNEEGRSLSEKQHKVKISKGFWMMETEVTNQQWEALMDSRSYSYSSRNYPVEDVTWFECNTFCNRASSRGIPLELPTEAQWEYACRAGTTGPFAGDFDTMTWYFGNSNYHSCEVKSLQPNPWGLYGMHGNVAEWCSDWCDIYPNKPVIDPKGPETGKKRITRGGSWGAPKPKCRSAFRGEGLEPDSKTVGLGFRCVINKSKEEVKGL